MVRPGHTLLSRLPIYIYVGQIPSTLTSRLPRTATPAALVPLSSPLLLVQYANKRNGVKGILFAERTGGRFAAALVFSLVTRSVRKRNRVKGALLRTLNRAHRLSTGPMRPNLEYFGF